MLTVCTSNIKYRGADRIDITAKSGDKDFAPTWGMVMGLKKGEISREEYIKNYLEMMKKFRRENPRKWVDLFSMNKVVLVCYCSPGDFCHRILLSQILVEEGAEYKGEI